MTWLSALTGVLMIGHSLFGPTNPAMLEQALRAGQPPDAAPVTVDAQITNGAPLRFNWDNGGAAEGVNARAVLPEGRHDVVILTEAVPLANHVQWSDSAGAALDYFALAQSGRPGTRVYLQETWHSLLSGTGAPVQWDDQAHLPWRDRLDRDLPVWQGIVDAVNATRPSGTPEMRLLPAGQALAHLHDEILRGTVPGLDEIGQIFADDIHLNDLGFWFVTMVQYGVLTGTSPEGLPRQFSDRWGNPHAAPAADLAARLQQVAWTVARDWTDGAPGAAPRSDTAQPAARPSALDRVDRKTQALPETAPRAQPGPTAPPQEPTPPAARPPLAIGLADIADWSPQAPFLDVMKTARPWIGHKPRQWGGANHADLDAAGYLDAQGWPLAIPPELSSIGTLVLTDMPAQAGYLSGRYLLRFQGQGIVEVSDRAQNVRYGRGEVRFDYAPGPGSVQIRIQRSLPSDPVRGLTLVREDRAALLDGGAVFNPDWLDQLRGFSALRMMDWMRTNNSTQGKWDDRPRVTDYTWALKGAPAEIMADLANAVQADLWVNLPHLADADYARNLGTLLRDRLAPERRLFAEYSNEVWNWQFVQARWADRMAIDRWGMADAWVQFYAARAVEMADTLAGVFDGQRDRLVNVISTQTGWLGLEDSILTAPLWTAESPGRTPPASHFDAYAVTGYFGGALGREDRAPLLRAWLAESLSLAADDARLAGLTGAAFDAHVAAHRFDLARALAWSEVDSGAESGERADSLRWLLDTVLPHHAEVARRHGLDLVVYEAGTHAVGLGPMLDDPAVTEFLIDFNYSDEMGDLYTRLLQGWADLGGGVMTAYADVYWPSRWGSWGSQRFLGDDNPRWRALVAAR